MQIAPSRKPIVRGTYMRRAKRRPSSAPRAAPAVASAVLSPDILRPFYSSGTRPFVKASSVARALAPALVRIRCRALRRARRGGVEQQPDRLGEDGQRDLLLAHQHPLQRLARDVERVAQSVPPVAKLH